MRAEQPPASSEPPGLPTLHTTAAALERAAEALRKLERLRNPPQVDWIDHCGTLPGSQYGVSCARCTEVVASAHDRRVVDEPATRKAMAAHVCRPKSAEQVQAEEREHKAAVAEQTERASQALRDALDLAGRFLPARPGSASKVALWAEQERLAQAIRDKYSAAVPGSAAAETGARLVWGEIVSDLEAGRL